MGRARTSLAAGRSVAAAHYGRTQAAAEIKGSGVGNGGLHLFTDKQGQVPTGWFGQKTCDAHDRQQS